MYWFLCKKEVSNDRKLICLWNYPYVNERHSAPFFLSLVWWSDNILIEGDWPFKFRGKKKFTLSTLIIISFIFCRFTSWVHFCDRECYCEQGSYRLWNSGKTMEFWKGNSIYGKTMEFEQNGRTYGKTMEFSFLWKKVRAFLKKNGGKICPDFNIWFQRLLLQLSLH